MRFISLTSSLDSRDSRFTMLTYLCCLLLVFSMTACGFHPVYGSRSVTQSTPAAQQFLASVAVSTDTARLSQLFKAELVDRLNPTHLPVNKRYKLDATIAEMNIPLFVAADGTYGRGNLQYTLTYTLIRIQDNRPLKTGTITRVSSYAASETNAIYASYVAQEDARNRGVVELATDMALTLSNLMERIEAKSVLKGKTP